ncbi:anti-sigma-I factor RsgI family protein [Saliterribacillus persicus]|uniref:RsgI N-terminal anti-sigma domain-containing protein n=1 Tax=Saliterribacillus persicus TaxID=930114 RepID=A0A368Y3N5_9BACI|nr:hypothetical protein [Saliterribacillus persicus]RCW74715.1 hypothetical protein DFR57_10311 [Saliterribacillus persicus]
MKNKKHGTVIEVEENHITLLSKDGSFHTVEREIDHFPIIGESFSFEVEENTSSKKIKLLLPLITIMTIILFTVFNLQQVEDNQATYLLVIDINPSVELTFDENWKLLGLKGLNEDGEKILVDLDIKEQQIGDVINSLISRLSEEGYIKSGELAEINSTLVRLEKDEIQQAVPLQTMLADAIVANGATPAIEVYEEEEAYYQEATENGVSINQYRKANEKRSGTSEKALDEQPADSTSEPIKVQEQEKNKKENKNVEQPKSDKAQNKEKNPKITNNIKEKKEQQAKDAPKNQPNKNKEKNSIKEEKSEAPDEIKQENNNSGEKNEQAKDVPKKADNDAVKEKPTPPETKESQSNQSEPKQNEGMQDNKKPEIKEKSSPESNKPTTNP